MKPSDLNRLSLPGEPRLHPTEDVAVFTVSRPNLDKDRYDGALWICDGGDVHAVPGRDGVRHPRWSPDGKKLAFLEKTADDADAKDSEKHHQLAICDDPRGTGSTRVLTRHALGVSRFEWSPAGDRILVVGQEYAEGWTGLDKEKRGKKPRRITAIPWRWDSQGTLDDRRPRFSLVDPTGQRTAKPIGWDGADEMVTAVDCAWHASGKKLALVVARYERVHRNRLMDLIVEVDTVTGATREIHRDGSWSQILYVGDRLYAVGLPAIYRWPEPASLWQVEAGKEPKDLLPSLDRTLVAVRGAGDEVAFTYEDRGKQLLARWKPGGEPVPVAKEFGFVSDFDVRASGEVAFTATSPVDPGEVYWDLGYGAKRVTCLNEDFRAEVKLTEPAHFTVNPGGSEVDAWVYLPEGADPVPVLLNIHGGPATQYGFKFFDEFQVYAGAGYGVVACNPRGSSGRGKDHLRAVRGAGWGEVDQVDVMAVLGEALKRYDRLDPQRVGVMGGSYGGFLTSWLVGRTDRFQSAVVERALVNWPSFNGTSDIGTIFARMYFDDPESEQFMKDKSPMTLAGKVKTPTLIIHSEQDHRCPIEQAEQYFTLLLKHGVAAEFLRFPGESHELSRSGNPKHREERFQAILDWHARHLGVEAHG